MSTKWRLGRKRWDWARSIRCLLTRHDWQHNARSGQRVCPRCWTVVDLCEPPLRIPSTPTPKEGL